MPQIATPRKNTKTSKAPVQSLPPLPPKKQEPPPPPPAPPVQQPRGASYSIEVNVDWENLPVQLARDAFEKLGKEYERAGRILNARTTTKPDPQFFCFMAGKPGCCEVGKAYATMPIFTDKTYKAPKGGYKDERTGQITPEGLVVLVEIAHPLCYHKFQELLIQERRERLNPAVNG